MTSLLSSALVPMELVYLARIFPGDEAVILSLGFINRTKTSIDMSSLLN